MLGKVGLTQLEVVLCIFYSVKPCEQLIKVEVYIKAVYFLGSMYVL